MTQSLGTLMVDIGANVASLQRDMNKASSVVEKSAKNMGRAFGTAIAGMISYQTIKAATDAFVKQDDAIRQLESRLKSTGNVVGYTSKELQDMASSLQSVTRFGDEATVEMQSLLLTFTNIRGGTFKQAVESVQDMATAMAAGNGGTPDLKSAAIQVGKALNDPIAGVTALSRAGVQFSDSQKATIQTLVESNRLFDAQQVVLKELQTQFGGAARAAGDRSGLGSALNGVHMAAGDALESLGSGGTGLIGTLNEMEKVLSSKDFQSGLAFISETLASIALTAVKAVSGLEKLSAWGQGVEQINLADNPYFNAPGRFAWDSPEAIKARGGTGGKVEWPTALSPVVVTEKIESKTKKAKLSDDDKAYESLVESMERLKSLNMANETAALEDGIASLDGVFLAMSDTMLPLNNSFDNTVTSLRLMSAEIPVTAEAMQQFTYTAGASIDELQSAFQNFGDVFTYTLADALTTGKMEWEDYTRFVLNSLARIAIQEAVTKPAFNWLGAVISGVAGGVASSGAGFTASTADLGGSYSLAGFRADGGPVIGGSTYVVGEEGPELFTPRSSGIIIPNGGAGGGGVVQNITVNAPNAAPGMEAKIRQAAEQGARMGYEMVKSDIDSRGPIRRGLGG